MKVFIADDEMPIVEMLCKSLESKGLLVSYALDGKEALILIKEQDYDLVFLDVDMPGLSGIEIVKDMKKNKIRAVIIFLTGYPTLTDNFCRLLGVDEYLKKPVELKVIEGIVDKYRKLLEKAV
jgi:DNA-binding response OmpR family regulator